MLRVPVLCLGRDTTASLKVTYYKQTLKNSPDKQQSGLAILAYLARYIEVKETYKRVSSHTKPYHTGAGF